jgi:hypothetical protein
MIRAVVCAVFLAGLSGIAWGEDMLKQLESHSADERAAAVKAIKSGKHVSWSSIVEIADRNMSEPLNHDIAETAISLLGDLHAVSAIPWLVEHVSFRKSITDVTGKRTYNNVFPRYDVLKPGPAARALVTIGPAVVSPLVEAVRLDRAPSDSRFERSYDSATVLVLVLGRKTAQERIKTELKKRNTPEQKTNLEQLLSDVQRVDVAK